MNLRKPLLVAFITLASASIAAAYTIQLVLSWKVNSPQPSITYTSTTIPVSAVLQTNSATLLVSEPTEAFVDGVKRFVGTTPPGSSSQITGILGGLSIGIHTITFAGYNTSTGALQDPIKTFQFRVAAPPPPCRMRVCQ